MGNTLTADKTNFENLIAGDTPVLVDFWAEWCGPCRAMAGPLDDLAGEKAGTLDVAKLNVDENQEISLKYQVMSIPTLILFRDGTEVKRVVGARSKAQLESELAAFLV